MHSGNSEVIIAALRAALAVALQSWSDAEKRACLTEVEWGHTEERRELAHDAAVSAQAQLREHGIEVRLV
jgi:hypothetical protein